jgi:hypothetical protein
LTIDGSDNEAGQNKERINEYHQLAEKWPVMQKFN